MMYIKYLMFLLILFYGCSGVSDSLNGISEDDINKMFSVIEYMNPDSAKREVDQFITDNNVCLDVSKLDDGVYTGVIPSGAMGFKYVLKFLVEKGRVKKAFYNEVTNEGFSKREDVKYCEMMEAENRGSAPYAAFSFYENQFILKQKINKIDVVSGATYSLCRMQLAYIKAIHTDK